MTDVARQLRLDPARWQAVLDRAEHLCRHDRLPSLGMAVGRSGTPAAVHLFGRQRLDPASDPIREDAVFLVASITKPIVAMAALRLVERGDLALCDRVGEIIPEFARHGKVAVSVRNLLTHTSGLPNMLPNNRELRVAHSPLAEFVEQTCDIKADFPPGRGLQYQSMGYAILGEVIARIAGCPCAEFVRREFFEPLGMHSTVLGAPPEWFDGPQPQANRIAEIHIPDDQVGEDWGWNSRYWRSFGAPWGGLLTTPLDLARFAHMMLGGGRCGDAQLLSPATVAAATRNQLDGLREVPEADRRCRPWGLGWRLNWSAHSANFGDLLGPRAYGHWGSTGTCLWIDPDRDAYAVLLSTQPQDPHGRHLAALSNMLAAALGP